MPDSSTTGTSSEISRTEPGVIRVLLIDENPEEAGSIKEMFTGFAGSSADRFRLHHVERISEGWLHLGWREMKSSCSVFRRRTGRDGIPQTGVPGRAASTRGHPGGFRR